MLFSCHSQVHRPTLSWAPEAYSSVAALKRASPSQYRHLCLQETFQNSENRLLRPQSFWGQLLLAQGYRVAFCSTATGCCFKLICKPKQTFTAVVASLFFFFLVVLSKKNLQNVFSVAKCRKIMRKGSYLPSPLL